MIPLPARLDVDNRVSMHYHATHAARWNIKGDHGQITLFIPSIWDDARKHSDFQECDHLEEVMEDFIGALVFGYLMERVCLERAHDRIRVKGGRCNPCCVAKTVNRMFDHIICNWKI